MTILPFNITQLLLEAELHVPARKVGLL